LEESSSLESFDLNTLKQHSVNIPSGLNGIAYSDKSKFFYGINASDGTLVEFDSHTGKILRTVKVGQEPSSITLSLHSDIAYVTNKSSDTLSVIDLANFKQISAPLVGSGPVKSILSSDGRILCILSERQRSISYLNTRDNVITATSAIDGTGADMALSHDDTTLYVIHNSTNKLISVSMTTRTTIKTLPVTSGPVGLVALRKVNKLYIIAAESKELLLVDPGEGIKQRIPLEFMPVSICSSCDADDTMLFITGRSLSGYVIAQYNRVTKECKILCQPSHQPLFIYPVYVW
jgi:YVTN family beta-propeller protein